MQPWLLQTKPLSNTGLLHNSSRSHHIRRIHFRLLLVQLKVSHRCFKKQFVQCALIFSMLTSQDVTADSWNDYFSTNNSEQADHNSQNSHTIYFLPLLQQAKVFTCKKSTDTKTSLHNSTWYYRNVNSVEFPAKVYRELFLEASLNRYCSIWRMSKLQVFKNTVPGLQGNFAADISPQLSNIIGEKRIPTIFLAILATLCPNVLRY